MGFENGQHMMLKHTRYVPASRRNLILLGVLDDENYHIEINNGFRYIIRYQKLIVDSPNSNIIYVISSELVSPKCVNLVT